MLDLRSLTSSLATAVWALGSHPTSPSKSPQPPPQRDLVDLIGIEGLLVHFNQLVLLVREGSHILKNGVFTRVQRPRGVTTMAAERQKWVWNVWKHPMTLHGTGIYAYIYIYNPIYIGLEPIMRIICCLFMSRSCQCQDLKTQFHWSCS